MKLNNFWPLLPRSCAVRLGGAMLQDGTQFLALLVSLSMELMQAKLDRLSSKMPSWFNVLFPSSSLTLQQVHQDWLRIPVLPRPRQRLLECHEGQIKGCRLSCEHPTSSKQGTTCSSGRMRRTS